MTAVRESDFEGLVARFFEAAAIPELWPDVLQELAHTCGAQMACALPVVGLEPLGLITSRGAIIDASSREFRFWHTPERNSRMRRSMALVSRGWRGIITEQHAFAPDDLAKDPFQQEFIVPHGFWSYAGAVVAADAAMALPISIERTARQGTYSHQEIEQMNRLFGRLRPAAALAIRLGMTASSQIADAFEQIGQAAALLGFEGRVLRMNPAFEGLMGRGLLVRNGKLAALNAEADGQLAAAIARCAKGGMTSQSADPVVLPPANGQGRPLLVQAFPIVGLAHDVFRVARVIVLVTDLGRRPAQPSTALLRQLFQLTPAEARLAARIAAGEKLSDIARAEGCTLETMRSRVKDVFDKTGTRRQTELALLLGRIAGGRGPAAEDPPSGG